MARRRQPRSHISHRGFLSARSQVSRNRSTLPPDLRRHTVKALPGSSRRCLSHIQDGPRNAAVTLFKRMDGDEPGGGPAPPLKPGPYRPLHEPAEESPESPSRRDAGGTVKWTRSFPVTPETTSIGPLPSSHQAPVLTLLLPLRPVGNNDAGHAKSLAAVSDCRYSRVASSVISTMPSTFRSAGVSAPISMPRHRVIEDCTCSASSFFPSISLLFTTSTVRVFNTAPWRSLNSSASIWPTSRPCRWRTSAIHARSQ